MFPSYNENRFVKENAFLRAPVNTTKPPTFRTARRLLPEPIWGNHDSAIECYWKAWEIGFGNLRVPARRSGFVSPFIETAFNEDLFMWDSAFALMFGKYGRRAFDFLQTLDNFYARQHPDGFICRQIVEKSGQDVFERYDPASTGPDIMAWVEWDYYLNFGDKKRLARVFPPLLAYHQWLGLNRTWKDGTYWCSGWGCGMDNQPRLDPPYHVHFSHGHLSWIDTTAQQILSSRMLCNIARVLGRGKDVEDLVAEAARLTKLVNARMWDRRSGFYHDRRADGSLLDVKSIGAYWALLAGIVPKGRRAAFIGHLRNSREFNRPHRVPSLSKDHAKYHPLGQYWLGGVWPPTNYMVLRGLNHVSESDLAAQIARNHVDNVVKVFEKTGTVWENYAPERAAEGNIAKGDFVGWSGLGPIAVLLEYVIGLRPDVPRKRLVWDIRLCEEHGVRKYPYGPDGSIDLLCARRTSPKRKPVVEVKSTIDVDIEVRWSGRSETLKIKATH